MRLLLITFSALAGFCIGAAFHFPAETQVWAFFGASVFSILTFLADVGCTWQQEAKRIQELVDWESRQDLIVETDHDYWYKK